MKFNQEKRRELALYIARAEKEDVTLGRVKLAKLLYYVDMETYVRLGIPITGATYMKRREGPAAREFVPIRDQMFAYGEATEVDVNYPNGMVGKKLVPNRDPNGDLFTPEELAIVDEVVDRFRGWSGARLSIFSHKEIGWQVATMDYVIPYNAYFLAPEPSQTQMRKAEQVVADLNLANAS